MNITEDNYSIDQLAQTITRQNCYMQGLDYTMISDVERNKFYDDLIENIVKDKIVCDIGFGSGILTMMALHHGAKKVYAFEQDAATFDFGKAVIERMGYTDKVEFFNKKWERTNPAYSYDIILHELFMRSMWGEGLKEIAISNRGFVGDIFPQLVTGNIVCLCDVVDTSTIGHAKIPEINTGIDYLDNMNECFKYLLNSPEYYAFYPNAHHKKQFNHHIGEYSININKETIPDIIQVEVDIPENCLVTTKCFAHDFEIVRPDGHWPADKIVYNETGGNKVFNHRTSDGAWWLNDNS